MSCSGGLIIGDWDRCGDRRVEIQYAKGRKFLTLVYQIEQHCTRLLWIGQERTVESFGQFFT